jgi:N-acyl-D-amino-acid deacylase
MMKHSFMIVGLLLALAAVKLHADESPAADFLIINARIVDGSGNPWLRGAVAVREGRIEWIGSVPPQGTRANRVIDAKDRVLAPGFIDLMGQDTSRYLDAPDTAASKLTQGITTHFSGEGGSAAPQNENTWPDLGDRSQQRRPRWRTFAEYFAILEARGVPLNVIHNVGTGQIRRVVMGERSGSPTVAEMAAMRASVEEAMQAGAVGLSSALIYPPDSFASTDELVELATIAGRYGGFYSLHLRNESARLLESIEEAITIGKRAGVPLHIYHLKAAGVDNWQLMSAAIERINRARAGGLDVTADVYPYVRNGIGLGAFIPPAAYARGSEALYRSLRSARTREELRRTIESGPADWENWYRHVGRDWNNVLITGKEAGADFVGLSVTQAASKQGTTAWDFVFDAVRTGVSVAPLSMDEMQKHLALAAPWVMIETDADPTSPAVDAAVHPRAYGAFPRVLAHYVREKHVLTLEEAVRRMTSAPANRLGLHDRGRVALSLAADLVLFGADRVQDHASFAEPSRYSTGMDYVWVNGVLAIDDAKVTGALPGKILKGARRQSPKQLAITW